MAEQQENVAAWVKVARGDYVLEKAPYPKVQAGELVIKTEAIGLNPGEAKRTRLDAFKMQYPLLVGSDVAGTVVEVAPDVEDFKIGDRVLAFTPVLVTNDPAHAGFQKYTRVYAATTAKIPDGLSFEQAATIPVAAATAASGLFVSAALPKVKPGKGEPNGKTLLVWGGSSAVGAFAIQFGVSLGFKVIATCSPSNFELVKSLGAEAVFDRSDPVVVSKIKQTGNVHLVFNAVPNAENLDQSAQALQPNGGTILQPLFANEKLTFPNVELKFVLCVRLLKENVDIGKWLFHDYIEPGLAQNKFLPLPTQILPGGLDSIQNGLDLLLENKVSGSKLIINPPETSI